MGKNDFNKDNQEPNWSSQTGKSLEIPMDVSYFHKKNNGLATKTSNTTQVVKNSHVDNETEEEGVSADC